MLKSPPHNTEAEKAVLAVLILKPDKVAAFKDRLSPQDFYVEKHGKVYQKLIEMSAAGETIDLVTLSDKVKGSVSPGYVASILDGIPSEINIDHYFKMLKEKAWLRQTISRAATVTQAAYGENFDETSKAIADLGANVHLDGQQRNIAAQIKDWARVTSGDFRVTEAYRQLHLVTKQELQSARTAFSRLAKDGYIVKSSKSDGIYRRIEVECDPIDWKKATTDSIALSLPFDLDGQVDIYPGNVIIVAGEANSGKTAAAIDFVKRNMGGYDIQYFSSEMGGSEFKIRLGLHEGIGLDEWKFTPWERSTNFADVIRPDSINIIDYLEVNEDFWKVGAVILDVHAKLKKGIALVCLQKSPGVELGRGAAFGTEKPRLYLTLNSTRDRKTHYVKIIKAKNWKGEDNPNGKLMYFTLWKGWKFNYGNDWHYPDKGELEAGGKRTYG